MANSSGSQGSSSNDAMKGGSSSQKTNQTNMGSGSMGTGSSKTNQDTSNKGGTPHSGSR